MKCVVLLVLAGDTCLAVAVSVSRLADTGVLGGAIHTRTTIQTGSKGTLVIICNTQSTLMEMISQTDICNAMNIDSDSKQLLPSFMLDCDPFPVLML